MYLLVSFILENLKKILGEDAELKEDIIFAPNWSQNCLFHAK